MGPITNSSFTDDKSGGRQRRTVLMTMFQEALADCNLEDMGFVGSRFTWDNRYTKERLDRSCCTHNWRALYPYSKVVTLPPNRSDHNPIVVEVGLKIGSTGKLLMEWDAGTFRQRKTEMFLLQSKMDMLMKLPFDHSHFEQQKALQFRYNELLSLEEVYWRQRSRVLWLKEGDHNSAFFHRKASNGRSRNKVAEGSDSAALEVVLEQIQPCVDNDMNSSLLAAYSDAEIKKALFQMHLSKSPGPDGILDSESNFTHLTLIPKIKEPKIASDFRPIALCRLISDNTLVASEVSHFMHKLRYQNEGFFSLKLDISKAYDKLEWTFLTAILSKMGFAQKWIDIVLCSIRTMRYSILLHVTQGSLKGLRMSHGAPVVHHLLFADDSFLFGEASVSECATLRSILNVYERASGQKINLDKSSVVFSKNVHPDVKGNLASILGVQCVEDHGRYPGLPLHVGKLKTAIFSYLKERLTKKLISWRTKILSSAGKEILMKAVAQVIPTYVMSCYMLPKGLCDDLHQLCAQFFWGGSDSNRKIHWRS
ncbi:uncharacterized protein LOC112184671 [Rosa chinensis]|uniref:uncharacterized protein LOC112184671 n=1 Tax=Rosa chinensis TaxID=74649 RepID=UPI000D0902C0|nr:uncharacterized protein LOC112184671 [Rosa chinensis]